MKLFTEEMESRSLTKVIQTYSREDHNGKEKRITNILMNMSRKGYAYMEGHGRDLAEFLKDIKIVNGFSPADKPKLADGAGCLAAQIIAHFKIAEFPPIRYIYEKDYGVLDEFYTIPLGKWGYYDVGDDGIVYGGAHHNSPVSLTQVLTESLP